jgi:uncharacterized protein YuzE
MNWTYDSQADAAYIAITTNEVAVTREIDEYTVVDFDKDNNVVGIELLAVKERKPELLAQFGVQA